MIRINCIENKEDNKSNYSGYITYNDLVKHAYLKPLTVNRLTDDRRLGKMTKYIEEKGNIYPPLVIALEPECKFEYDSSKHQLLIDVHETQDRKFIIIDGQHRFRSIEELLKYKNDESTLSRKQSIFIITNVSDIDQRKLFMDINNNMKTVSNVSKRIFEVSIPNYISLYIIKNLNIVKNINIKNDQCTKSYPYKFILSGNKILFGGLDIDSYDEEQLEINLNKYKEKGFIIWKEILNFIEKNTKLELKINKLNANINNYKSIKTEIFINAFMTVLMKENNNLIENDNDILKNIVKNKIKFIDSGTYFEHEKEILELDKEKKKAKIIECLEERENE